MGARGTVIGSSGVRSSHRVPVLDDLLDFACRACLLLFEAEHLNFIVLVFKNLELFFVVEEVHAVATVYFEHANKKLNPLLVGCKFEDVVDGVLGDRIDSESLA